MYLLGLWIPGNLSAKALLLNKCHILIWSLFGIFTAQKMKNLKSKYNVDQIFTAMS